MVEHADGLIVLKDGFIFTVPVLAVADSHMQAPEAWVCADSNKR